MKELKSLIRLKKWSLDERQRDLVELQNLKDELAQRAKALDDELERERAFVSEAPIPPRGYSEFLKLSLKKRAQLSRSMDQIDVQIAQVRESIAVEFEAMKQAEVALEKAEAREARKQKKAEQDELDEIAGTTHRRRITAAASL